jgi:hypothetical protein
MQTIILERSQEEPVTDEYLENMRLAAEACFEINDVTRKATYVSADGKRFVCLFEARDLQSVQRSLESVGMDYQELWVAGHAF